MDCIADCSWHGQLNLHETFSTSLLLRAIVIICGSSSLLYFCGATNGGYWGPRAGLAGGSPLKQVFRPFVDSALKLLMNETVH